MLVLLVSLLLVLALMGIYDRLQRHTPVRRVFPVLGRFARLVVPLSRRTDPSAYRAGPFSRSDVLDIRSRALTGESTASFGSPMALSSTHDASVVDVALLPETPDPLTGIDLFGAAGERHNISLLNFGAMGLGPVSANVVRAVSFAAQEVGCHLNTGEEGLLAVHGSERENLVWQIGTGYWGCRNPDGTFSEEAFRRTVTSRAVGCIEVKISQGGKPGAGGLLPAAKNTRHVARALGVPPRTDVVSPPSHSAFHSIETMLEFVQRLAEASGGKPVGIKVCVGSRRPAHQLASAMVTTGITPAFITVDGGEGGTGASIRELQDHAGIGLTGALMMLDEELMNLDQRQRVRLFASGSVKNGFDLFRLMCLGADGCFFTRAPLIALGCVQARICHTGTCPAGIASHSAWRRSAVHPPSQGRQLARYYRTVIDGLLQLMRASGARSVEELRPDRLVRFQGRP